jgi:hypothetical protein
MSDLREVFPILQDSATGAGEAPISRIEGEVAAGQEGLIGFSFKDSSGNVVLPSLDAQGRLPVVTDAVAGTCHNEYGELAAGSVGTFVDLTEEGGASITLTVGKTYTNLGITVSATRTSVYKLIYVDDDGGGGETETILGTWIVGPGAFTQCCELNCRELDTTGGTGTQTLKIQGKNLTHATCLRGEISALELA